MKVTNFREDNWFVKVANTYPIYNMPIIHVDDICELLRRVAFSLLMTMYLSYAVFGLVILFAMNDMQSELPALLLFSIASGVLLLFGGFVFIAEYGIRKLIDSNWEIENSWLFKKIHALVRRFECGGSVNQDSIIYDIAHRVVIYDKPADNPCRLARRFIGYVVFLGCLTYVGVSLVVFWMFLIHGYVPIDSLSGLIQSMMVIGFTGYAIAIGVTISELLSLLWSKTSNIRAKKYSENKEAKKAIIESRRSKFCTKIKIVPTGE